MHLNILNNTSHAVLRIQLFRSISSAHLVFCSIEASTYRCPCELLGLLGQIKRTLTNLEWNLSTQYQGNWFFYHSLSLLYLISTLNVAHKIVPFNLPYHPNERNIRFSVNASLCPPNSEEWSNLWISFLLTIHFTYFAIISPINFSLWYNSLLHYKKLSFINFRWFPCSP